MNVPIEQSTPRSVAQWGFRRGLRLAGIIVAASVWLAALIWGGAGSPFDENLYRAAYADGNPILARNAIFLTALGGWKVLVPVAIAAAIFLAYKRRLRAALLLITVFGGRLLVELQKVLVDRPRPGVSPHLEAVHSLSFPSSHATNGMITYLAIAVLLPVRHRLRAVAVGIALALAFQIGWSRIALGVHWPTDVVGGWAFGLVWVSICMRLASSRPEGDASSSSR